MLKVLNARLRHDQRAVAAVEFAIILPLMITLVLGVFDISKAVILYQQVYNSAHTIPLIASILAVQPDKTTTLTVAQVQQALSAVYAEMPLIRSGVERGTRSVTMSSVIFLPTNATCVQSSTNNCAMAPNVAWSVPYSDANAVNFTKVTRQCGVLRQTTPAAGDTGSQILTSLRTANVTNPDPILVVDVHYQYIPLFLKFLTGPVDFWASGYWPVRSVAPSAAQQTTYDLSNQNGGAGKCPGFP